MMSQFLMGFLSKPSMPTFEIESQKDKFYGYPETYAFILILKTLREKVKEITCGVYIKSVLFFVMPSNKKYSYSCLFNYPAVIQVSDCILY